MDLDMEQFRMQFFQEARDILDSINDDILKAETDPENTEILDSIFRGIHTIKGSAGSFELPEISEFAHHLEGILDALRKGEIKLNADIVDAILEGCDVINNMIDTCEKEGNVEIPDELVKRFKSLANKDTKQEDIRPVERKEEPSISIDKRVISTLKPYKEKGLNIYKVQLRYESEHFENGYDPMILMKNLKENSEFYLAETDISNIPVIEDFNPLKLYLKTELFLATHLNSAQLLDLTFDPSLIEVVDIGDLLDGKDEKTEPKPIEIDQEMINEFIIGAEELIDNMDKSALEYEKTKSEASLNEIFRAVHTIKGDAAYIELETVNKFSHVFEDVVERIKKGTISVTPQIMDTIFKSTDALKNMINSLKEGNYNLSLPPIHDKLNEIITGKKIEVQDEKATYKFIDKEEEQVFLEQILQYREILKDNMDNLKDNENTRKICKRCLESLLNASKFMDIKPMMALSERCLECIKEGRFDDARSIMDEIITFIEGLEKETKRIGEILIEQGKLTEEELHKALSKQKPVGQILLEDGKIKEEDITDALKRQEIMESASQFKDRVQKEKASTVKTMRIDESKIDRFTNMIGELVVARNTYEYILENIIRSDGMSDQSIIKALKDNLYLFSRITNEMQQGVISLRMIPIKNVFGRFQRVVRDMSRRQRKSIELIIDGGDTEIDKKVADMLSDPLIHLVRNACDHGIETPEERRKASKPETGTLILRAMQEGSNLIIKVIDDGRGIDRKKLYEKAKSMGLDIPMDDTRRLYELIFMAGVSTRENVTDISGRGVGMDVVKTTINSLGGSVQVISEEGKGTEITMTIPMNMGVTMALMIEVDGNIYAIPMDNVVETVKLSNGRLRRIHNRMGFYYRGQVLPVERLSILLDKNERPKGISEDEMPIVVLRSQKGKFGIIVDNFVQNMEIAIKPVPQQLSDIEIISGVTVLGDGRVVLLLNPEKLI